MPRKYVRKKPDHQTERLGEHTYDLDCRHQRQRQLQPGGNIRPENLLPIMPVSEYVDGEEGEQGKHKGHRYVAGNVGPAREERHQTHQVVDQYEKEGSQKIRRIPPVILPYAVLGYVILNHHDHHFHKAGKARRDLRAGIVTPVPVRREKHQQHKQQAVEQQSGHILGNRKVQWPEPASVRQGLHYAALAATLRRDY